MPHFVTIWRKSHSITVGSKSKCILRITNSFVDDHKSFGSNQFINPNEMAT